MLRLERVKIKGHQIGIREVECVGQSCRMFTFDVCDKQYVKHQLKQTDEINTDEYEDIEEVALPVDTLSDFVAI